MVSSNIGMNIAQTTNAAATMSQYQHSKKQAQQGDQTGIFRRIPPTSILPQLFEINIISLLSGNLEAATAFLVDSVALEKLGITNFVEKHELGLFSTLNIFEQPLYAGDALFQPGGEEQGDSEMFGADAMMPSDSSAGSDAGGTSDFDGANSASAGLWDNLSQIKSMQDFNSSGLGGLSPDSTPNMPSYPSEEIDDSIFSRQRRSR